MTEHVLPTHLEALGRQLTDAAHRLATPVGGAAASQRSQVARPHRRLLAGSTLGVAGCGAALVIALGTSVTPPAFAVTRHHDGSVSITINRRSGIAGANRRLAAMGIHEHVFAIGDLGKAIPVIQEPSNSPMGGGVTAARGTEIGTGSSEPVCLMNQPGQPPMPIVFASVGQAEQAISTHSIRSPSAPAGNTGGTPQPGPWRVDACYSFTGPAVSGNTGNTGNTGNG